MIQGIDHLVILVDELDAAVARYRRLGFTVTPGGKHPRGTHNALVPFQDGSYLELIAFWEPDYDQHQWHKYLATGGGLIDYALGTDDLAGEIATLRDRGVRYTEPRDGARSRPDGVEVVWKTAAPAAEAETALPFLIEDVTDRTLRVPGGEAAEHANGVRGIDRLVVAVDDLEAIGGRYASLVGAEPLPGASETVDQPATAVALRVGAHHVELHRPQGEGPMAARVERSGVGPYAAVLYGSAAREIRADEASGARLRVIVR
jgi:hypothetical protein